MFFQLQEALHKVIFYKVFHAGSGSAFIRQLDTHWKKLLDPDPHKMNTDPPSWPSVGTSEKFFIHPLLSRDASDFRLAGYPAFFLYPVSGRIPDKMFEYPAGLGYKKSQNPNCPGTVCVQYFQYQVLWKQKQIQVIPVPSYPIVSSRAVPQAGPTYVMDIAVSVATVAVVLFFAAVLLSNVPWARILGHTKQEEGEQEQEDKSEEEEEEESGVSKEKEE